MTTPWNAMTLNGFTFSTPVACGFSIQSTSSKSRVIRSPVFLQLGSRSSKFELRSAVATSIDVFNANSGFIDQKSTAGINSWLTTSTSHFDPPSGLKSINALSLKSFTTKPDLNLFKPSASLTWNVLVSNSNALNEVILSKFSILCSSLPISRIVYLRLSFILIIGSRTTS